MQWAYDLSGAIDLTRKFRIGATLVEGQPVQWNGIAATGVVTDPTSVNAITLPVGVTDEAATYATSSPHVFASVHYSPSAIFRGKASGGTTLNTSHTTATLITQATASTTVLTAASVATIDYSGGYVIGLTGANKGHTRILTSQVDSTSCTVTVAFGSSVAVGDTLLRTYSEGIRGVEMTTDFTQWNNLLAAGEALYTDSIGPFVVIDVIIDGSSVAQSEYVPILNPTDPVLEFECRLVNHAFGNRAS